MMVYGHQTSPPDDSYLVQSYLGSARRLPNEAAAAQAQRQPQPEPQLLLPPPPKLLFQGVTDNGSNSGNSDSGFLYSLLTAQDATAVQQCSAFLGGTADQFPRRSQSVSVPARRGSAALPATSQPLAAALSQLSAGRPSSVPRGLRGPCGGGSAPTLTGEEPLDLSRQQQQQQQQLPCDSMLEQQLLLQHQQLLLHQLQQQLEQPMLRNMLSHGPQQQQQVQVQLAKKTVPVVQSHVADWLKKGTELVRTNSALFGALAPADRAGLLCRAWPRILQLYMMEHGFQFTVSPANEAVAADADGAGVCDLWPTQAFAEELQRMIVAAGNVPLDNMTYNLLRLAAIFVAESPEEHCQLTEVQEEIMKHILRHLSMKGMSNYIKDAAAMLEAVSRTDKCMLENLFCNHLLNMPVDDFIRSQLGY